MTLLNHFKQSVVVKTRKYSFETAHRIFMSIFGIFFSLKIKNIFGMNYLFVSIRK